MLRILKKIDALNAVCYLRDKRRNGACGKRIKFLFRLLVAERTNLIDNSLRLRKRVAQLIQTVLIVNLVNLFAELLHIVGGEVE